ncbi:MAG: hypothetical protein ACYC3W_00595 [Candidatus Nanopelagicales bacterium]
MIISCDGCVMRDLACTDCVVTHFLALPAPQPVGAVDLGPNEQRALTVLQGSGLLPPWRMREQPHVRAVGD